MKIVLEILAAALYNKYYTHTTTIENMAVTYSREGGHCEEEKKEKPHRFISGDDGRSALLWNPGNSWDSFKVKLPDA